MQRDEVHARMVVRVRVLPGEDRRQVVQVRLRLRHAHARPEPGHGHQEMIAALLGDGFTVGRLVHPRRGHPEFDGLVLEGKPEARRHHADDLAGVAVHPQRAAKHVRVAAETPLPQAVAEDHHAAARRVLRRQEAPAQRGRDAERREQAGRNDGALRVRGRLAVVGEREVGRRKSGDPFQRRVPRAPVGEVRVGNRSRGVPPGFRVALVPFRNRDEPLRVRERQRAQEHGVDHAEHGRVRPDAQRQRQRGDEREHGLPGQRAQAVAKILQQAVQHGDSG